MRKIIILTLFCLGITINSMGGGKMRLRSSSFKEGGNIPKKFVMISIGGENISPEFEWQGAPANTKSFALVMVDPHPIARNWLHWAVVDIPKDITSLDQGWSGSGKCKRCRELINSYGFKGYGGPQPPRGTGKHPYVTTVYALDCEKLSVRDNPTYKELIEAISPHVLDKAEYIGYYEQ